MGMRTGMGEGYLSDPYYDADGGMSLLCSYILPIHDGKGSKVGLYCIDLSLDWLENTIEEDLENVRKEFLSDSKNIGESDDKPYFSIQIIDSQGRKIIGSDSLDTSILNGKKKETFIGSEMVDLTGTPYYTTPGNWQVRIGRWLCFSIIVWCICGGMCWLPSSSSS